MSMQVPFWHHDGPMTGWHWGWGLFWLLLAALIIWGAARAMSSGRRPAAGGQTDAEESLRRRFAAGEITREEFQERLEVLRDSK